MKFTSQIISRSTYIILTAVLVISRVAPLFLCSHQEETCSVCNELEVDLRGQREEGHSVLVVQYYCTAKETTGKQRAKGRLQGRSMNVLSDTQDFIQTHVL